MTARDCKIWGTKPLHCLKDDKLCSCLKAERDRIFTRNYLRGLGVFVIGAGLIWGFLA
ncbi:hypothetical protein LCGC14_1763450 [marine sediment metagenome]|uniref:Uncharacterized protein n=1 Tax=marine sediment metagenome TaxID=412755 RepID=A0A0F9HMU2_9ZZZZ